MIEKLKSKYPFVAFVGAGASAIPPSRLPTWYQFNDLVLQCLCDQLASYSRNRQPTDDMMKMFHQRRNETRFFTPDFQAQLMEEEIGQAYFKVWQSLESDIYGPVHSGLAELAANGQLAAIITTNFDRLSEVAMTERGVKYEVFYDQQTFEVLESVSKNCRSEILPIIKIHGTIENTDSLVDTLKQRVVGRPQVLESILRNLLEQFPWLYLGFSGADFNYDPNYLGILDAAKEAKGFVFVAREGTEVNKGVANLQEAYGKEKASIVFGELQTWLVKTFAYQAELPLPSEEQLENYNPQMLVNKGVVEWVNELGPIAVINIIYAMLKSTGLEEQALWLMRKTWKSYRIPSDTKGKSYNRYNYNFGVSLLENGFINNPFSLDENLDNFIAWREAADWNAFEYLNRSYDNGVFLSAGAKLTSVMAYRGEVGRAISLLAKITDDIIKQDTKLELCDAAIASVVVYDITRFLNLPIPQFRHCLDISKALGDEPRRATLSLHLGRFLTYSGQFEEANIFIEQAEQIGERLDLQKVLLECKAVRGRWLSDSGTSDEEAVSLLQEVLNTIHAQDDIPLFMKYDALNPDKGPHLIKGKNPLLCRVLLDLNRAAFFKGDIEVLNKTLDELDEITIEKYVGYVPHYYFSFAHLLIQTKDPDNLEKSKELIASARKLGEVSGNPWPAQEADRLEQALSKR